MSSKREDWSDEDDFHFLQLLLTKGWKVAINEGGGGVLDRKISQIRNHANGWRGKYGGDKFVKLINRLHVAYHRMNCRIVYGDNGHGASPIDIGVQDGGAHVISPPTLPASPPQVMAANTSITTMPPDAIFFDTETGEFCRLGHDIW